MKDLTRGSIAYLILTMAAPTAAGMVLRRFAPSGSRDVEPETAVICRRA